MAPPFAVETWLRPIVSTQSADANKIAGGWIYAKHFDVILLDKSGHYQVTRCSEEDIIKSADDRNKASEVIDNFYTPRSDFANLSMSNCHLMGIINTTPDSFSDGGANLASAAAIKAGLTMWREGASIIDVGGESTRPGAEAISRNQELARVLPAITGLVRHKARVSIDTRHGMVMTRACGAGAEIINDVEALRGEGALNAASDTGANVILMHMQGKPENMQDNPRYDFAPIEVYRFLETRIQKAINAGIKKSQIAVDPGFGFGKTVLHNLEIVNWLSLFHGLGVPILFGGSRKSTIASLSRNEGVQQRVPGSIVLAMAAFRQGVQMLRVHDVVETAQALAIEKAMIKNEK